VQHVDEEARLLAQRQDQGTAARARDQMRLGALMLAGFVGAAVLLGWLMYPFPL